MIALGIALPSRGRMVDGHVERTDVLVSGAEPVYVAQSE